VAITPTDLLAGGDPVAEALPRQRAGFLDSPDRDRL
jgi:hypothetical protein